MPQKYTGPSAQIPLSFMIIVLPNLNWRCGGEKKYEVIRLEKEAKTETTALNDFVASSSKRRSQVTKFRMELFLLLV